MERLRNNAFDRPKNIQKPIGIMATLSFHAPPDVEKKIRRAARQKGIPVSRFLREAAEREVFRDKASFGEWARRVSGMVRSGKGDLSTREGFGN